MDIPDQVYKTVERYTCRVQLLNKACSCCEYPWKTESSLNEAAIGALFILNQSLMEIVSQNKGQVQRLVLMYQLFLFFMQNLENIYSPTFFGYLPKSQFLVSMAIFNIWRMVENQSERKEINTPVMMSVLCGLIHLKTKQNKTHLSNVARLHQALSCVLSVGSSLARKACEKNLSLSA